MRHKIIVKSHDNVIYKGKMVNMPVKETAIKEKSVELFEDDDPCIIHQSYVMKHFAQTLASLFEQKDTKTLRLDDVEDELDFLDFEGDNITITLKG